MSEEETLTLALSTEQAETILQGLRQGDGPGRLQFRIGPEGEEETTVLVDAASGELQTGTFEGVTNLEVLLSNTATSAGDLGPVDALGVPWRFAIRPDQQGGSLRSSATDSVFSDLQGLSGHAHLVFIGLQKVVGLRDLAPLADLPALTGLTINYCTGLEDVGAVANHTGLKNLTLANSPLVRDLTPLRALTNLERLYLSNQPLSALSFMEAAHQLTSLTVGSCEGLTDISAVSGLTRLESLTLKGAYSAPLELPDLRCLTALTGLTHLNLSYSKLGADQSWLSALGALESLELSRVEGLSSVQWLNDTPNLKTLDLSLTQIVEWPMGPPLPALRELEIESPPTDGFFERLTHLETLSIKALPSLRPIAALASLRHLLVRDELGESSIQVLEGITSLESLEVKLPNAPCDLGPLSHHTELRSLALKNISWPLDVSPLSAMTGLEKLDLGRMSASRKEERQRAMAVRRGKEDPGLPTPDPMDLAPLAALTSLKEVNLVGRRDVVDLAALGACTAVERLDLSSTRVADLTPLSEWNQLVRLTLRPAERITDLRPLAKLESLRWLQASACAVESLAGLGELPQLATLSVEHCPNLTDVTELRTLSSLTTLTLTGNRKVEDYTPLESLTQLSYLHLGESTELHALPDLTEHRLLNSLNLTKCENLRNIEGLTGLTGLTRLDIDGCAALDVTRMAPLLTLSGLTEISGNVTPAYRARIFAQGAVRRRDPSVLFSLTPGSRRGEPGKPHYEAWRVICEGDPQEPYLIADVAAVCAMALDRTEGAHRLWDAELPSGPAETLSTLISLGSRSPAEGAELLVRSALSARLEPQVREAIDAAVIQGDRPLPPGVLNALQDQLASVGEPWTTCHAEGLRDRALLAVVRPSESPCPWRAETAGFISAKMSQHSSEDLPEGYGVHQDVFGEILTSLETERDQRSDEVEALAFSALAMDHARSEDPDWLNAFHHRLTEFALGSGDDPQRNRLLSSLTAGVSRSQDGAWAKERIDVLLARAAEIDPDTSIVQSAVADGHAASGRWTAAEEAAFGIARPGVRDQTLSRLADEVLTTELEDRARRSLSMRNGLVDPLDRREALMALGAHEALHGDLVAYGQLMGALASDPEAQQTVAAHAVEENPELAATAPVAPEGPVTDREHRIVQSAVANRDRAWQEALGVEVPPELEKRSS